MVGHDPDIDLGLDVDQTPDIERGLDVDQTLDNQAPDVGLDTGEGDVDRGPEKTAMSENRERKRRRKRRHGNERIAGSRHDLILTLVIQKPPSCNIVLDTCMSERNFKTRVI
jgi:hypothetical protein